MTDTLNDFLPGGDKTDKRTNLIGMDMDALKTAMESVGEKSFRAKQIYSWLYSKGAKAIDDMTDLSKPLRERLNEIYVVGRPVVTSHQKSVDGTQKWLLKFFDGNEAEMVFIPETDRGTLCVSSQVGCTLTCKFCHTGTQKLVRNLEVSEIVAQVIIARDMVEGWQLNGEKRTLSNIVFMGMGEPLYNTDNVIDALKILTDKSGIAISKRKITVSTSGVADQLERLAVETNASLAISLHAPDDETRTQIMPINKKYNLETLMDICRKYPNLSNTNRITWEYVMLKGVNDTNEHAQKLAKLIKGIPSKVNLIPFNPWDNSPYECSDADQIENFAQVLLSNKIPAPIRKTRGEDIMAACGQLKSESQRIGKWQKK
ncbi:MAG: 23S rRNA (adenine(2503)-C(2))-methyltransferase RlmN [Alphaproteobacteria bacterium]